MKVRAKVSFSGLISMHTGQEREIDNEYILNDLIGAGYVEPVSLPVEIEHMSPAEEVKTFEEPAIAEKTPVKKVPPRKKKT